MSPLSFLTARSNAISSVLILAVEILSVRRLLCDNAKEHNADILASYERSRLKPASFLLPRMVGGDIPSILYFYPFTPSKCQIRQISGHCVTHTDNRQTADGRRRQITHHDNCLTLRCKCNVQLITELFGSSFIRPRDNDRKSIEFDTLKG